MHLISQLSSFFQVVIIDLSLAADNAIIIGLAVSGLPARERHRAVLFGLGGAVVLRIILACFAVKILDIAGLTLAGGLLLLWVAWKMLWQIRRSRKMIEEATRPNEVPKKLSQAISQILVADLGMSLDNILGVAGAAHDHYVVLALGLLLSVALVGAAATATAKLFHRWPWLGWVGIATVLYVAIDMMADGIGDIHQIMTGVRGF